MGGKSRSILLATIFVLGLPCAAHAQAWLGELAARISAEKKAGDDASKCFAGVPQPDDKRDRISADSNLLLESYFALTSSADQKALGAVFTAGVKGESWRKGGETRAISALGGELDIEPPKLVRSAFVVSGDGQSARGLWRPASGSTDPIYIVDFVYSPSKLFSNSWRIWRMAIMPDSAESAALVYPYCRMDDEVPANLLAVLYANDGKPFRPAGQ